MAITGATKADALAAARKYGMEIEEMQATLAVANVAPTVTASEGDPQEVTVAWTNILGPYLVDIGDGVLRSVANTESDLVVADVAVDDGYVATVYGLGAKKSSAAYNVTGE